MLNKIRVPEIVFGALLTVAVFAMGMLYDSSRHHPQQAEQQQHAEQTSQKTKTISADERIADYTWWLAVLTGGLVAASVIQGYFLLRADKTARIAANAADLSARAATIIEFPIIRSPWIGPELMVTDELLAHGQSYAGSVNEGLPTQFSVISELSYRNFGRSPAFPVQMQLGFAVTKQLPETPFYKRKAACSPGTVIPERDKAVIEIDYGFELTDAERAAIANSSAALWFYVLITYRDIMDRTREIGSCWQWGKMNKDDGVMYFF